MDTGDTVYAAAGAQLCEDEGPLTAHGTLRHQVWNNLTYINFRLLQFICVFGQAEIYMNRAPLASVSVLMRIWIQLFTSMRIRIQWGKSIPIHADPDPGQTLPS